MRSSFTKLAFGLTFASLSFAHPTSNTGLVSIFKRTVTPDNTCGMIMAGANNNYTCDATASNGGPCCSQFGYCGNSTDFCGVGCQPQNSIAGSCTGGGSQETCGPANGGAKCSNNQCCSQSGFCGTTSDYCADPGSCLVGYGKCDSDATPAGPSTENAPRPLLGSVSYTDDISDCVQDNVVALTYDDGPYLYTAQLLDILKSYGFTATFFITGNNNGKGEIDTTSPYPDLIKRMIAEGHQVASHTWSHYNLSSSSSAVRISQMVKNEMAFNNIIGKWPTYMRPPYSECSASSGCQTDMKKLGYHRVYFDLDTQDYLNPSPNMIQKSKDIVKQQLAVSGVTDYLSIQHDIVEQSVTNLTSYYFDLIKAKGWKGVTVGTCLGDPSTNWYRSLSSSSSSTSASSSATSSAATRTSTVSSGTTSRATTSATSAPTSSATTTATSTSKPIITTTSAQPTATAPASPGCDYSNGKWCGVIDDFNSLLTCNKAVFDCWSQAPKCLTVGGIGGLSTCLQWNNACAKLSSYCLKCLTGSCSNAGAGY